MVSIVFTNLVLLSIVFSVSCILVGRLRQHEETDGKDNQLLYESIDSNAVVGSRLMYPDSDRIICKTDLGYPGRCVDIRQCNAARQAVRARNHPVRCGWINNYIPRVCCHPDQVQRFKMVFRPYRRRNRIRIE